MNRFVLKFLSSPGKLYPQWMQNDPAGCQKFLQDREMRGLQREGCFSQIVSGGGGYRGLTENAIGKKGSGMEGMFGISPAGIRGAGLY